MAVELRELVLRFAEDPAWAPAVASELTAAIHGELPQLQVDEDLRRGTYASTRGVVELFIEHQRRGLPLADVQPPPAAVEFARDLVRRGLPLDTLLRSYHVGHAAFFRRWTTEARATLDDPGDLALAIEEAATATFAFVQALEGGVVRRWTDERERWERSAAAVRAEVVRALLAGEPLNEAEAGARLGYALGGRHVAFVVWAPDEDGTPDLGALDQAAARLADALGGGGARLLVPLRGRLVAGWVALGPGRSPGEPTRGGRDAIVAIGSPAAGVEGFRRSHLLAMEARRVARLERRRTGATIRYDSVAVTALASADLEHARAFVAGELGPLAGDDDDARRLAATLHAFLEEGASPRRTARRLGVHENTVTNRIHAVETQLGHPVRARMTELLVALRLVAAVRGGDGP